ncbi:MAG: NAD-dependent epimerase/dehydratase family protein [Actinobacteria bacterium]|nr:NAD-dependent epimerase/dehydratase family protein [Actinomycetota bacterium]
MALRVAIAGGTGVVGRHAVEGARRRGHEVVVLSRSQGVDLLDADSLARALDGVDAIVDASNPESTEEEPATEFFTAVTGNLQREGARAGAGHLVTLSIIGIDAVPVGYYAAKLAQERAAAAGPVPLSILRTSPFHEFAAQMVSWTREGSRAKILDLRLQTVAARTVGTALVEIAEADPVGRAADLAGPEADDLVDLARRLVERREAEIEVEADTDGLEGIPRDAFLPGEGARIEGPTFGDWLASEDALAVPL